MEIIGGLIFLAVFGAIVGSIIAILYCGIASVMARDTPERGSAVAKAAFLAYASAAWLCLIASIFVANQDSFVHLPNGYSIRLDEDDNNLLLNLKTQPRQGAIGTAASYDTVGDVKQLQMAGQYMLGVGNEFGTSSEYRANALFLLDTKTGRVDVFPSLGTLQVAARKMNIEVRLEPIRNIYSRYAEVSFLWFLLAFLPPAIVGLWGLRQLFYLRGERGPDYERIEPRAD